MHIVLRYTQWQSHTYTHTHDARNNTKLNFAKLTMGEQNMHPKIFRITSISWQVFCIFHMQILWRIKLELRELNECG